MIKKASVLRQAFDEFREKVSDSLDKAVNEWAPEAYQDLGIALNLTGYPKVDVYSDNESIIIIADVVKHKKENVKVKIEDYTLTIEGTAREGYHIPTMRAQSQTEADNSSNNFYYPRFILKEIKLSNFKRSFILSEEMDVNNVKAKFLDSGFLEIIIPRKTTQTATAKEIKIQ